MEEEDWLTREIDISPGFIVAEPGREGLVGVFEDSNETGDLYLYDASSNSILAWCQIYQSPAHLLSIRPSDVLVVWTEDFGKVGVLVWQEMRGVIDVRRGREAHLFVTDRDSPAINDAVWLEGFEWVWPQIRAKLPQQ